MTREEYKALADNYEVCRCMCVSLSEIVEAINVGHESVDAIVEHTDAGSACELCQTREIDEDDERDIHLDEILEFTKE